MHLPCDKREGRILIVNLNVISQVNFNYDINQNILTL